MVTIKACIAALVIALAVLVGLVTVNAGLRADLAKRSADLSDLRADIATQRESFEAKARQREREQSAAIAGLNAIFEQELSNAQTHHDTVVAGLRTDNLRLRNHWQGCVATAELSYASTATARPDAAAELRGQGAADLVRVGAECDARIRGLQSIVKVIGAPASP